jgi:hypothetical protein
MKCNFSDFWRRIQIAGFLIASILGCLVGTALGQVPTGVPGVPVGLDPLPPPFPPNTDREWEFDALDIVMSKLFDDPAATPEERAAALQAIIDSSKDLTNSAAQLYLGRLIDRMLEKVPEGIGRDALKDFLERMVERVVPERSRPSLEDRLGAMFDVLEQRYPNRVYPIRILKDIVMEVVGPYLPDIQVRVDAFHVIGALVIYLDVSRRVGRENPLLDRIPAEQFNEAFAQITLDGRERLGEADRIRSAAQDRSYQLRYQRALARSLEEQRRQQELPRTGQTYHGGGGGYATSRPSPPPHPNRTFGSITFSKSGPDGVSYSYSGNFGGSEPGPIDFLPLLAQAFQREHLANLMILSSRGAENELGSSRDTSRQSGESADGWYLPTSLSTGAKSRPVLPAIRHVKPLTEMISYEYSIEGDENPLGFAFAADTSATRTPYNGAISTCTQTTFGLIVDDIVSDNGLLIYEFGSGPVQMFGAQWFVIITDGTARIRNPVVAPHETFQPGTRLLTYQVLLPDRKSIQEIFHHVKDTLSRRFRIEFAGEAAPPNWIKDAELVHDRLIARIVHRGEDTSAELKIVMWPRTYLVAAGSARIFRVPLQPGENYFSAQLPWYPGACSVDLQHEGRQSLAFLQREIVPLGDTRIAESTGSRELRKGLIPLLGYQRGVRLKGKPAVAHFPFASFKQRWMDLENSSGLIVDVTAERSLELTVRLRTHLRGAIDQGPVAKVKLSPGRHSIEIPWARFSEIPAGAYGATMWLAESGPEVEEVDAIIHQVAIATTEQWGRYLNVGEWQVDFVQPIDHACVIADLLPATKEAPLWFPLSPSDLPQELCEYARLRVRVGESKLTSVSKSKSQSLSQNSIGIRLARLSESHPRDDRQLASAFHPEFGCLQLKAPNSPQSEFTIIPEQLIGRSFGVQIGKGPVPAGHREWRTFAFLATGLILLVFTTRVLRRRHIVLRGSFILACVGFALAPFLPNPSEVGSQNVARKGVYWPYKDDSLVLIKESGEQVKVLPSLGPTIVDPIGPSPDLMAQQATSTELTESAERKLPFADFSAGRVTVFGSEVGGFNSTGGYSRAEVIDARRDGQNEQVLSVTASTANDAHAGVYFKNPSEGISLRDARSFRFDARSERGQADWVLEIKQGENVLAACQVVIPQGDWHVVDIPLDKLDELATKSVPTFDELVFKFTSPQTHLLLDNLRLIR